MKRLFLIIGLLLILLAGCSDSNDKVTITVDLGAYTPAMSSVRGISMTPNFETKKNYEHIVFHWESSEGEFIGYDWDFSEGEGIRNRKEVKNQGETVLWSAIENDKVVNIMEDFDINLEVIDSESNKVLASTKLTITADNGFYKVKK